MPYNKTEVVLVFAFIALCTICSVVISCICKKDIGNDEKCAPELTLLFILSLATSGVSLIILFIIKSFIL